MKEIWMWIVGILASLLIYAFAGLGYMHSNFFTRSEAHAQEKRIDGMENQLQQTLDKMDRKFDRMDDKLDRLIRERSR